MVIFGKVTLIEEVSPQVWGSRYLEHTPAACDGFVLCDPGRSFQQVHKLFSIGAGQ
jgi:hypothetical protein